MTKGIFYHSIAKVIVVLSAYILHFFLGKILTIEEYGIVGTIITLTNFYYLFLTNGVRQSISKDISTGFYKTREVLKKGMVLQTAFGIGLGALNFILAPLMASLFGNSELEIYFRYVSLLIPFTAVYFGFTGALNGMKAFLAEAAVTMVYPLVRLTAIPLISLFENYRPLGITTGFIISSVITAVLTCIFVYSNKKIRVTPNNVQNLSYKKTIKDASYFIYFFAAVTIILNLDTFTLMAVKKSEYLTGLYTAVCNFSLVAYYLVSAFYLVILPYITECSQKGDLKKASDIVAKNIKLIIVIILPIVILLSVSSQNLLSNFYNPEYAVAAPILSLLVFGIFFLAIYVVFNMAINGMGKQKETMKLSVILVVADIVLQIILINNFGIMGAALATSVISLIGCIASYKILRKYLDKILRTREHVKTLMVIGIFTVICIILFNRVSFSNLFSIIAAYAILALTYFAIMFKLKIISKKELLSN